VQVLTADGSYLPVDDPRSRTWPLAGTQYQTEYSQGWAGLRMSALPSGEARILSYRRIYRSNPWVWTAVNTIARGLSGLPLRIYDYGPGGQLLPVHSELPQTRPGPPSAGQRLEHLLAHPAPFISRRRTVRRTAVDKLVYGNGLWIKEPDGFGGTAALYNVPWREVSVIAGKDTPILGYRIWGGSGTFVVPQDQVIQFGEGDPDGPIAPSPLESLQWTIALSDAMSRHLVAYFQNSARPSGVLELSQMPDDRELAIMREEIAQLYSGAENAGRPLITSGKWQSMSEGTNYADLVELARLSREEVAAAYGIPPPVMGILDRAIKSNVAELREMFLRDVLAPHGSEFTDEIEAQMIEPNPAWSGLTAGFDMSQQLMPDLEAFAIASKDLKSVFTINELRRMAGLPDLDFEWANQPWAVPGSLPMGLAPQGAEINPDDLEADPEDDQVLPGDDEADDEDLAA
jgi:HK97 family phage portal protein